MRTTFSERFRAMGTNVHVMLVGGDPTAIDAVRCRIADLERRWSRFLPSSEVSRLNGAAGAPVLVSTATRTLLARAVDGYESTRGRFDPFQLHALTALGYRQTFSRIGRPVVDAPRPARIAHGRMVVDIDDVAGTVALAPGIGFDPGGIGKGLAADFVIDEFLARGVEGALINIGGDVRVAGCPAHGDAWTIAVRNCADDQPHAHVRVVDGAVATTSRSRRRWVAADGTPYHHVIDPRTGRSAETRVEHATAIAAAGWQAEVLSTAAFLDGVAGIGVAESMGATALVATEDRVVAGPGWSRFACTTEVAA